MARLYCPKELINGKQIVINEREKIHYLCDVLRLKVNDDVFVFDGQAHEYHCRIQGLSKKGVTLLIKKETNVKSQRKTNLTIACALPRQKSRFDDLVDKLSQLGVDRIIPMITERVIVRWDSNQRQRHHQRWQKIVRAACSQSGRNTFVDIQPVKEMSRILSEYDAFELKLVPTLLERKRTIRDVLAGALPKSILALIGPEGDFTKEEVDRAQAAGFVPVSLGEMVLRVDTAAIAVAAFFRLYENCKILYPWLQGKSI